MSWWKNYEEEFVEMVSYYEAILERKDELEQFFKEYKKETMYRLVFESNTIENEGLEAKDTKKLSLGIDKELNESLHDAFKKLNEGNEGLTSLNYEQNQSNSLMLLFNNTINHLDNENFDFDNYSDIVFAEIQKYLYKEMHKHFKHEDLQFINDSISGKAQVNFKNTLKEFQITFNQIFLLTVNNSFTDLILFLIERLKPIIKNFDIDLIKSLLQGPLKENFSEVDIDQLAGFLEQVGSLDEGNLKGVACSFLSSGEYLKTLHELVANKLANNDNGLPGEYRYEAAFVDLDTTFLQASLIDGAMKNLANSSFDRSLKKDYNFILEACQNSALFIKIHPFGDFNGRISRVMLNNFFIMNNLPFFLVLRSGSRDKKKYIEAMRRYYNRRKIDKYLSLICKTFKKHIEEINDSLEIAGIEGIKAKKLNEERVTELKSSLRFYNL